MSKPRSKGNAMGKKNTVRYSPIEPKKQVKVNWVLYEAAWASPVSDKLIVLGMIHGLKMTVEEAKDAAAKKFDVPVSLVSVRKPLAGEKDFK